MGASATDRSAVRDHALVFERVTTVYAGERRPAIFDISLSIRYGEIVAIRGPNGAGKTTLLETALGLLTPRSGRVWLLGHLIPRDVYRARRHVSYLPQDFIYPPNEPFTARQVVAMGLLTQRRLRSLSPEDWRRVDVALEQLGVKEVADRPIGRLSGGQQQRVLLARALVRQPRLLLLDEPFSALDPEARELVATLLLQLNRGMKTTIVLVSHADLPTYLRIDRTLWMQNGRLQGA